MPTASQYALMSGCAYVDTRASINRIPLPQDWSRISRYPESSSGFEASAFQPGNEIVISFAGKGPELTDDAWACYALTVGDSCAQLREAAAYYMEIKKDIVLESGLPLTLIPPRQAQQATSVE